MSEDEKTPDTQAAVWPCGCTGTLSYQPFQIAGLWEETLQFDLCPDHQRQHGDEDWWAENDLPRIPGCGCPVCYSETDGTIKDDWREFVETGWLV